MYLILSYLEFSNWCVKHRLYHDKFAMGYTKYIKDYGFKSFKTIIIIINILIILKPWIFYVFCDIINYIYDIHLDRGFYHSVIQLSYLKVM